MAKEIERKFLVQKGVWRPKSQGHYCRQGYLSTVKERVVRVRVVGDMGFLTIKGITEGFSRLEFEYEIPERDAHQLLDTLCEPPLIEKTRYQEEYRGLNWEIDVFEGDNEGLILAEVELKRINQQIDPPKWIGEEVSHDSKYFNSNLAVHPYSSWTKGEKSEL